MPSLRAYLGISLAALLHLSVAAPMPATLVPAARRDARCFPVLPAATPSLPVNGGGTELPAPVNVTLKYVAIGRGIQNYTCSAVNATPVALGAIATLFDGTLYASTNPTDFDTIPATVVYQPVPADVLTSGSNSFPLLGHHYFDSTGTPTFDLSTVSDLLVGKKTADIKAPSTANVGPGGTGAVDWLQLQDKGGSIGVTEVYRVVTAGGNANATCTSTSVMSIQYAAQYWFY